jgi:Altronate dehydratase
MAAIQAIIMKPADNVCTVVEAVQAGSEVLASLGGTTSRLRVSDSIPFGHKFAIRDIARGAAIIKYGEIIGLATEDIKAGRYVHVHNLESCRGRGDK